MPSKPIEFQINVANAIRQECRDAGAPGALVRYLDDVANDPRKVSGWISDAGEFGSVILNSVFAELRRTEASDRLRDADVVKCLVTLIERGAPWFASARAQMAASRQRPISENPILSSHRWSQGLRSALAARDVAFQGMGHSKVVQAANAIERELVLGGDRVPVGSGGVAAWGGTGANFFSSRMNELQICASAHGEQGKRSELHRQLLAVFRFCHRLYLHWNGDAAQKARLLAARQDVHARLQVLVRTDALVKRSLRQIAVLDALEPLVSCARSAGQEFPRHTQANWPADPESPMRAALPCLTTFATMETLHGASSRTNSASCELADSLRCPAFLDDVVNYLQSDAAGLERGAGIAGYPRFSDPNEDFRLVQRRVRWLIRLAFINKSNIEQYLMPGSSDLDRACVRMLTRGSQEEVQLIGLRQDAGMAAHDAAHLVQLEVDSLMASERDVGFTGNLELIRANVPTSSLKQAFPQQLCDAATRLYPTGARHAFFTSVLAQQQQPSYFARVLDGSIGDLDALVRSNFHIDWDLDGLKTVASRSEFTGHEQRRKNFQLRYLFGSEERRGLRDDVAPRDRFEEEGYFNQRSSAEMQHLVLSEQGFFTRHTPPLHALLWDAATSPAACAAVENLYAQAEAADTANALQRVWNSAAHERDGRGRPRGVMIGWACPPSLLGSGGLVGGQLPRYQVDFTATSDTGVTPLMAAARSVRDADAKRLGVLRGVLDSGLTRGALGAIDQQDRRGWRAIHHAYSCGNMAMASLLLEFGSSPAILPGDKTTILIEAFQAAKKGHTQLVNAAINAILANGALGSAHDQHQLAHRKSEFVTFEGPTMLNGDPLTALGVAMDGNIGLGIELLNQVDQLLSSDVWKPEGDAYVFPAITQQSCDVVRGLFQAHGGFSGMLEANDHALAKRVVLGLIGSLKAENATEVSSKLALLHQRGVLRLPDGAFHRLSQQLAVNAAAGAPISGPSVQAIVGAMVEAPGAAEFIGQGHDGENAVQMAWRSGQQVLAASLACIGGVQAGALERAGRYLSSSHFQQRAVPELRRLEVLDDGAVKLRTHLGEFELGFGDSGESTKVEAPWGPSQASAWIQSNRPRIASRIAVALGVATLEQRFLAFENLLSLLFVEPPVGFGSDEDGDRQCCIG